MRARECKDRAETAEEQLRLIREQVNFLNAEIERITHYQKDFDKVLTDKEEEISSYKENVSTYVSLKFN